MNPNRKTIKCEVCGSDAEVEVVADSFDDAEWCQNSAEANPHAESELQPRLSGV